MADIQTITEIREQQRQTWNKFSPGWRKWDVLVLDFLKPVGDELIKSVSLKPDYRVLDVATGTGEPGLTAATKVKKGKVIGTDLSEEMVKIAEDNARMRRIKNFETVVCDVSSLPFEGNYFNAVICRFGFMFFPDMLASAKEMTRVLKAGGKISTSVWSPPEKNPWATTIVGTINKMMGLTPPSSEAPGLFRCAENGMMKKLFEQAGLKNVKETEVKVKQRFDSAEEYWAFMNEVAAPVVAALSKADDAMREKIKQTVLEIAEKNYSSQEKIMLDGSAWVIVGLK